MYLHACTHVHAHAQTHAHTNRKTHTATKNKFLFIGHAYQSVLPPHPSIDNQHNPHHQE